MTNTRGPHDGRVLEWLTRWRRARAGDVTRWPRARMAHEMETCSLGRRDGSGPPGHTMASTSGPRDGRVLEWSRDASGPPGHVMASTSPRDGSVLARHTRWQRARSGHAMAA